MTINDLVEAVMLDNYFYTYDYTSNMEIRYSVKDDECGRYGWGVRPRNQGQYLIFDPAHISRVLASLNIDEQEIYNQLYATVSSQAFYHYQKVTKYKELMTEELFNASCYEWSEFFEELTTTIDSLLKPKPKLSIIKE